MIRSMTGFARSARSGEWGELDLELRSVNHRYLDFKIMLPDALKALEESFRTGLRARLVRGRVEAVLRWRPPPGSAVNINHGLALEVAAAARRLAEEVGEIAAPIADGLRLLAWPGVIEPAQPALDPVNREVISLLEETLSLLIAAREREGLSLAAALEERLTKLEAGLARIAARHGEAEAGVRARLAVRVEALGTDVDPLRVAQEAALLLVRQDASEELERLGIHVGEARRLLAAPRATGRQLDFLLQELGREANTLAAKVSDVAIGREALQFKVLIEEMREQAQNVE